MNITLNNQTKQRLKRAAEQTGIPEGDIIDRALDVFLITEQIGGLKELAEDMSYWQQRYFDTLVLDEERLFSSVLVLVIYPLNESRRLHS